MAGYTSRSFTMNIILTWLKTPDQQTRSLIEQALIHCWELIPDYLFERLVEGIPRRILALAVIKAKGWYTKI